MDINFFALLGAALIPLAVGAVWYNPKVMGTAWMKSIGKTEKDLEGGNMILIFALTFFLSIFLALAISQMTNHQSGVLQLFAMHPDFEKSGTPTYELYQQIMNQFGTAHRSFGHGALHGAFAAVFFALPLIAINSLFERKGAKYIFIHFGYWLITITLIGGVVCAFL